MKVSKLLLLSAIATTTTAVLFAQHHVYLLGDSMMPTYLPGTLLESEPFVGQALHRGDIVVAQTPAGRLIKRIGFVAGDRVSSIVVGVDGRRDSILDIPRKGQMRFCRRLIKLGTVYLLGDAWKSIDSMSFGAIPISQVERVIRSPRPFAVGPGSRRLTYIESRQSSGKVAVQ